MILVPIAAVAVILLLASLWSLEAPARPIWMVASLVAAALFGWQTVEHWMGNLHCERVLSLHRRHDFDLAGAGERKLRVDPFPGIQSLSIRILQHDGEPVDRKILQEFLRVARDGSGPIALNLDPEAPLVEELDLGDEPRPAFEITYTVTEATRPFLAGTQVFVSPSKFHQKSCTVYRDIDRIAAGVCLGGALLGFTGALSQAVRFAHRPPRAPRES